MHPHDRVDQGSDRPDHLGAAHVSRLTPPGTSPAHCYDTRVKALLVVGPLVAVVVACSSSSSGPTGFGHDASASSSGSSSGGSGGSSGGTGSSSGGSSGSGSGGGQCATATDCKTHAENCGTCVCIALGVNEPAPDCDGGATIKCTPDPCTGHTVTCDSSQNCVLQ